jgi:hypothetical protein
MEMSGQDRTLEENPGYEAAWAVNVWTRWGRNR